MSTQNDKLQMKDGRGYQHGAEIISVQKNEQISGN